MNYHFLDYYFSNIIFRVILSPYHIQLFEDTTLNQYIFCKKRLKYNLENFRGKTLKLKIDTSKRTELVDITSQVQEEVRKSEISEGICLISTRHTTVGIIINENENGLKNDILDLLNKLVPAGAGYRQKEQWRIK
jgi:hypothetical protein